MSKDKKKFEKRKLTIFNKMKKMLVYLLVQRRSIPGAKGFELKKLIGTKYTFIANLLNKELETYGLKLKIVFQDKNIENPSLQDYDKAYFYITTSEPIIATPLKGQFNMEELGALAASILLIYSKNNKYEYENLIDFLSNKISKLKTRRFIDKFIKKGYLEIDENNILSLGWRTYAEIDLQMLTKIIAIYSV
jgi:hypothetical protein